MIPAESGLGGSRSERITVSTSVADSSANRLDVPRIDTMAAEVFALDVASIPYEVDSESVSACETSAAFGRTNTAGANVRRAAN